MNLQENMAFPVTVWEKTEVMIPGETMMRTEMCYKFYFIGQVAAGKEDLHDFLFLEEKMRKWIRTSGKKKKTESSLLKESNRFLVFFQSVKVKQKKNLV